MGGGALFTWLHLVRALRLSVLLLVGALCGGCLFYDSSWGEAKASQKRVAARRMPGQLRGETGGAERDTARPVARLKIRAYATPHYAGALVDGQAEFEQALADANPTLAHDLSFRLELDAYSVWSGAVSDDDLSQLVLQIKKKDSAEDVDWVVVLASPREVVATSADHLGVGLLLGRHLAIRAMSDAAEFDVIDKGFDELSEEEKRRLYAARKRHKTAAVLLHELGHTLGMPHELGSRSLMSAKYDSDAQGFGAHAARLGRHALELRATGVGSELHRNAAQAALGVLRSAPAHTWDAAGVREVEALFELHAKVWAGGTAKPAPAQRSAKASTSSGLPEADGRLLERVRAAQAAGQIAEARGLAAPLFASYPKDYAIQELRCQLAMKAGLPMTEERAECEPLLQLSGAR